MKKLYIVLTIILSSASIVLGQNNDTIHKSYEDINDLNRQTKDKEIDLTKYIDSTYCFEVKIPNWMNLKETTTINLWGGTLPPVDGIENAILINSFDKSDFKSFSSFQEVLIDFNKFGEPMLLSESHTYMGGKLLSDVIGIGPSKKVYLMFNNLLYDCQFVITETKTAYVWISFTATRETYEKNVVKFEEFLKGFKLIK